MDGVSLRTFEAADADWLIRAHGAHYRSSEGFDATFEALVSEIVRGFLAAHDPERERGIVAARGNRRLGSVFCVRGGVPEEAKLRLFLVVAEGRGLGLGQRLLEACLGFAQAAGYARIGLRTHESHLAACALYARNGFALTASKPVRSFGVDLAEQRWSRAL